MTITELANFYKISRNHLVIVVHNLGLIGYILTGRGMNGGIKLAHAAKEILIGEAVKERIAFFQIHPDHPQLMI